MFNSQWVIVCSDIEILQDLAKQILEISFDSKNEERRQL